MPICRKQVARVMKNFRSLDEGYGHHSGELLRRAPLEKCATGLQLENNFKHRLSHQVTAKRRFFSRPLKKYHRKSLGTAPAF